MQRLNPVRVGESVPEMHEVDLALEIEARNRLNAGIAKCFDKGDNGTRDLLESILTSEEDGIDWLETHLDLIEALGKERYLAEMI
jgi:bacterioferritin